VNFFERQRAARGTSARLVLLFLVAVVALVAVIDLVAFLALSYVNSRTTTAANGEPSRADLPIGGWLIAISVITLLIIGCGMAFKTMQLRQGGAAVASALGAVAVDPTTTDPQLRRFTNIVEEMSLASGVPMPRLFVLEREPGINAFAAGYSPADAAVTVTRGALDQLNRDELQGVIGHEFSHILNGDMRLNIRLIGLLAGIGLIALIGLRIVQFGPRGGGRDKEGAGIAVVIMVVGLAAMILGFVGQLFASLIQAAVGRQREWLADASSVQFTRQTTGLAGALKTIGGYGSELKDKRTASEFSHMLFGEGGRGLTQLMATHPPLLQRITALEPDFRPEQLGDPSSMTPSPDRASEAVAGFAGGETPTRRVQVAPADISARVGTMTPQDIENGQALSSQIPNQFRQLAGQASSAVPLAVAMLLSGQPDEGARQLAIVRTGLGEWDAQTAAALAPQLAGLATQLRLPLLSIAAPQIITRPAGDLTKVLAVLDALARIDGTVTIFEYCLTRVVAANIRDANDPSARSKPGTKPAAGSREAAANVLAALAAAGNEDQAAAEHAYRTGLHTLTGADSVPGDYPAAVQRISAGWQVLDAAWPKLDSLEARAKQVLVEAMVAAVRDDGVLTLHEAELLRTACLLLHCPLPAFVA